LCFRCFGARGHGDNPERHSRLLEFVTYLGATTAL
jgi:hypothetical protein